MDIKRPRPGRPRKSSDRKKSDAVLVRVEAREKAAFKDAADLAGIALSAWMRERLRWAAIKELEAAARPVAFLNDLRLE